MLKHIIILVLVSAMVTYDTTKTWVESALHKFIWGHDQIVAGLSHVFSQASDTPLWVTLLSRSLALFIIPLIITGFFAFGFWAVRRYKMPYFMLVFWFVWVLEVAVILSQVSA